VSSSVRLDDQSTPQLLSERAGRSAHAGGKRGDRPRGPAALGRVDSIRGPRFAARLRRRRLRTRSTSAAAASIRFAGRSVRRHEHLRAFRDAQVRPADWSFREGWEGFLRQQRVRRVTRPTKCVACTLKSACGMCPANGELENGDPEAPVDYLCHSAHLRAHALGLAITPHGACEYCAGGSRHAAIVESASRLRQNAEAIVRHEGSHTVDGQRLPHVVDGPAANGCSRAAYADIDRRRKWWTTTRQRRPNRRNPTSSRTSRKSRCDPKRLCSAPARRRRGQARLSSGAAPRRAAARCCREVLNARRTMR